MADPITIPAFPVGGIQAEDSATLRWLRETLAPATGFDWWEIPPDEMPYPIGELTLQRDRDVRLSNRDLAWAEEFWQVKAMSVDQSGTERRRINDAIHNALQGRTNRAAPYGCTVVSCFREEKVRLNERRGEGQGYILHGGAVYRIRIAGPQNVIARQ